MYSHRNVSWKFNVEIVKYFFLCFWYECFIFFHSRIMFLLVSIHESLPILFKRWPTLTHTHSRTSHSVRLKGGCWDDSKPIFIYTTLNHVKYLLQVRSLPVLTPLILTWFDIDFTFVMVTNRLRVEIVQSDCFHDLFLLHSCLPVCVCVYLSVKTLLYCLVYPFVR